MSLMSSGNRRVAKQLFKEFIIPLSLALAWAIFAGWGKPFSLAAFVANFAPAFFFVSWLLGQVFRVSKQVRTESSLSKIGDRLDDVVTGLEQSAKEAVAWATGGNSFAYVIPANQGTADTPPARVTLITQGEYPLFQVSLRIVDIDAFATIEVMNEAAIEATQIRLDLGDLDSARAWVNFAHLALRADPGAVDRRYNLFFMARNGQWVQLVRYRYDGTAWHTATRVKRTTAEGESETLHEQIPDNFPNPETLDWS